MPAVNAKAADAMAHNGFVFAILILAGETDSVAREQTRPAQIGRAHV